MKRSKAIKKLKDYLEAQDVLNDIAEDVLDFIEKEIGMVYLNEHYEREWDKE